MASAIEERSVPVEDSTDPQVELKEVEENPIIGIVIVTPAGEEISISVSPNESFQEIRAFLAEEHHACIYTAYHFQSANQTLKEESGDLLSALPEIKDGTVINMVEDSYTDHESRAHLRRLRDVLGTGRRVGPTQLVAFGDLSDAETVWDGVKADPSDAHRDVALLSQYHPKSAEPIKCLKSLNYSGFNPPPANRRLMGDFYYIDFTPLDGETVTITANTRGFYVNQCKNGKFNPLAATKPCHAATLYGCLSQISPKFKKSFTDMLEQVAKQRGQEQGQIPFPPNPWLGKSKAHEYDLARTEDDIAACAETEFLIVGQPRDWNEELQQCRALPRSTPQENIIRDRSLYRVHAEFVQAATQSALAIFNGQVPPLNPGENQRALMYLHNNIFFTQGADARDQYAECGGDETLVKSLSNDIVALRYFNQADPEDLSTLDNVMITYCGRRLFAQTLIPGLFAGILNGENTVVYGSLEDNGVKADPEFHKRIEKIAAPLHLKEHKVANSPKKIEGAEQTQEPSEVSLWTSVEVKGIVGTDGRYYLLDFGRLLARDGNYSSEKTPTAVFRPELISSFANRLYRMAQFQRMAEIRKKYEAAKKIAAEKGEPTPPLPEEFEKASESIQFPDVRLNTDLFAKGVKLTDSEEVLKADENLNKEISNYLTDEVITILLRDWISGSPLPSDTQTLTALLHQRGINMRYLGHITTRALQHVPTMRDVLFREMVVRAAKTAYARLVQKVPMYSIAEFTASFLNSFFDKVSTVNKGSRSGVKPAHLTDAQAATQAASSQDEFGLSHYTLWVTIRQLVEQKFAFTLPEFIPAGVFDLATLRALCLRLGIRIEAKNYDFNKDKPFEPAHILEMLPLVKHACPSSNEGAQLAGYGKQLMLEGQDEAATELLQEALNVYNQCYGPLHRETGNCFTNLAMIAYQNQDLEVAVAHQERAVLITERVLGPDHLDTAHAYGNLGTMAAAAGQVPAALNYLRRALYLSLVAAGWSHPELVVTYLNLAGILQENKDWSESIPILTKALKITEYNLKEAENKDATKEVKPSENDKNALMDAAINGYHYAMAANIYHMLAMAHGALNNFREALEHEKKNYNLLTTLNVPSTDPRLNESNVWLRELTKKAVEHEKLIKTQAAANDLTSRLGKKKAVSTQALNQAKQKLAQGDASLATGPASVKRGFVPQTFTANPNAIIGRGVSLSKPAAAAQPQPATSSNAKKPAKGKKKSTNPNQSVPDLI